MKFILIGLLITGSVLAIEIEPYYEADLPNLAVGITTNEKGEFVEVIVNEWHDKVKTKDGIKNFIFHQGYDYSKQEGFVRTYNTDMKLLHEEYSRENDGMVVREEMIQAFDIFKADPTVNNLLEEVSEPITIHGGFNYADDQPTEACYFGSRCVHVIASTPSIAVVAHAIVKLVDKSVPYPEFDTDPVTHATIELKMKQNREKRGKL